MGRGLRIGLLVGALLFLLAFRLGGLPLSNPDEGRNATVALEMAHSGDWLVPTYLGAPYLDKPAAYFAAVALSLKLFGANEAAARLPSVIAAALVLFLVARFARRHYGERSAMLAAVSLGSMPLFLVLARTVIFDMTLTLWTTVSILSAYEAWESGRPRRSWILLSAAAAGVATLVKGPVGFLIPGLVHAVFATVEGRGRVLWSRVFPVSVAVVLVVVLPWFVALSIRRPDFPYYGLVVESFQRFTTDDFQRSGPWWYYPPVLLGVCFGWSMLFPGAAGVALRRWRSLRRVDRFALLWVVVVVAFFTSSRSKLPGYVLPALPALALLTGRTFDAAWEDSGGSASRLVRRAGFVLAAAAALLAAWTFVQQAHPSVMDRIGATHGSDYRRVTVLFPHILRLSLVVVALSGFALWRRDLRALVLAFALSGGGLVLAPAGALDALAQRTSSLGLARAIEEQAQGAEIVLVESFSNGLGFYTGESPSLVTQDGFETTSNYIPFLLSRESKWPSRFIRSSEPTTWLDQGPRPRLLVSDGRHRARLEEIARLRGLPLLPLVDGWFCVRLPASR